MPNRLLLLPVVWLSVSAVCPAAGDGATHQLTLDVRRGDCLRFVVHKRGSIGCDTTGWDPTVRYPGGGRTQSTARRRPSRRPQERNSKEPAGQPVAMPEIQ